MSQMTLIVTSQWAPTEACVSLSVMDRLTRQQIQTFTTVVPVLLSHFETVLASVFDEQGSRWSELKLRVGAAMSAVELASHSRLQPRRALWHASMVLMTLRDAATDADTARTVDTVASLAHTLSIVAIACDSEVASEESLRQARAFIDALPQEPPTWPQVLSAHRAAD